MSKYSCETQNPTIFVDFGGLDCRDLMPAKALADNIQTAGQRGVAEGAVSFAVERESDCRNKRLLWIGQLRLPLGKCSFECPAGFTNRAHTAPPCSRHPR